MTLIDRDVTDLLVAFRSPDPTPGGGSASALAGAIGASLLTKVAGLPKSRADTEQDFERLKSAGERCLDLAGQLTALVDADSDAYDRVAAAYRLPRGTDAEKTARSAAVQQALKGATETPLEVMRACAAAIEQASVVAQFGNSNAASDVQVALELLTAGLRGGQQNVAINLGSVKDRVWAESAHAEGERLAAEASAGAAAAAARLAS